MKAENGRIAMEAAQLEQRARALGVEKERVIRAAEEVRETVREKERAMRSRRFAEERTLQNRIRVLQEALADEESLETEESNAHHAAVEELRAEHERALTELDRGVKAEVSQKDEEIAVLGDAIQTEKVKLARITKLLKKYTSSSSSAAV